MKVYRRETGAIITAEFKVLQLIEGEVGSVSFPFNILWEIHKAWPTIMFALSHIHPPTMTALSDRDKQMLKALALSFYPWPVRLITICETGDPVLSKHDRSFYETCYFAHFESRQSWVSRGKTTPRKFEILPEWQKLQYAGSYDDRWRTPWYGNMLLEKSYDEQQEEH